jgi:hypothetical protein
MSCDICKLDHVTPLCPQQTGYGLGSKPVVDRVTEAIASRDKDWVRWGETFFKDLTTMSDTQFEKKHGINYHLDLLDILEQVWSKRKKDLGKSRLNYSIVSVRLGNEEKYLEEGWEPFGVSPHDESYEFYATNQKRFVTEHRTVDYIHLRKLTIKEGSS